MNLNRVPLIQFWVFFPIDFIGGHVSKGVSRGSVGGHLTGGKCFVKTPLSGLCFGLFERDMNCKRN